MSLSDSAFQQRIANLGKHVSARAKDSKVYQLPIWPEPTRGIPNPVLRGALFAAVQGKNRAVFQRELLACQKGLQIRFTGIQLDQSDLDVWEQALHLARLHPLGTRCDFSVYGFLKALGRKTGKSEHEWLKNSFARLMGCGVELTNQQERKTYGGSLLEFMRDDESGRYVVIFNPKILTFYEGGWTAIDWQDRQLLRGKPLALWLHGYLATHAKPYPIKIETIRSFSGSSNKAIRGFKRKLIAALNELKKIAFIMGFDFEGDNVIINKPPTPSQQRYLINQ
ncbi:plasmid replication initiator TrfA [Methylobacter psychrophilus]|uniref:plasmid replication initiator TrfA n=1 Tax=Methylobacter psychrophilus TaxID=96941 RepID=UPI0021D49B44|nr:plasmid replication initiator TrfA [Methylobacter psychrophilus]